MKFVLGMYATAPFAMLAFDAMDEGAWMWMAATALLLTLAIWVVVCWLRVDRPQRDWLEAEALRARMARRAETLQRLERMDRKRRRL